MLHHRYAVNNAGSSARGLKFSESCVEKGDGIENRSILLSLTTIFLFPVFSRRKLIFENIEWVCKVFGGCSEKEKRQGKQRLKKFVR